MNHKIGSLCISYAPFFIIHILVTIKLELFYRFSISLCLVMIISTDLLS